MGNSGGKEAKSDQDGSPVVTHYREGASNKNVPSTSRSRSLKPTASPPLSNGGSIELPQHPVTKIGRPANLTEKRTVHQNFPQTMSYQSKEKSLHRPKATAQNVIQKSLSKNEKSQTNHKSHPLSDIPLDSPSKILVEGSSQSAPMPTEFRWEGKANEVFVAGTFTQWQDHIPLQQNSDGNFSTTVYLSPGEYQYKYIVDGVWMHDTRSPTCSNSLGSINNLMKIVGSSLCISENDSTLLVEDSNHGRSSPPGEYGQEIPDLWKVTPPALPPQLLQVTLNAEHPENDPTQLPEPNHVMLSHLYALSIKDNVIVLGSTNRYRKKYVTTVLYKPTKSR